MFRTIIAGTAVAGALSLGRGGRWPGRQEQRAAASTPASTSARCAKLPALQAKVQKVESKVTARLPKVEAREATLSQKARRSRPTHWPPG